MPAVLQNSFLSTNHSPHIENYRQKTSREVRIYQKFHLRRLEMDTFPRISMELERITSWLSEREIWISDQSFSWNTWRRWSEIRRVCADSEESVTGIFISPARWSSPVKMKKMMMKIEKLAGIFVALECGVGKIGAGLLYSKCRLLTWTV